MGRPRKNASELLGHRSRKEKSKRALQDALDRGDYAALAQLAQDADQTEPSAPAVASGTLADFLADVRNERASFEARVRPNATVLLDGTAEYKWPEGDAASIARQYAADIALGVIPAGDLIRYAVMRFLAYLEKGHARGFYFDPVAARNVVRFAKDFCALELLPWQVWVLTELFGWKRVTGFRRFQEAWLSMARKNGKTTFASTIALFLLVADQEKYAEVYSAATAKPQASKVWNDAKRIVKAHPELASAVKRWSGDLEAGDDCHFKPLASEERSFLGERASGIVADEVGVWADRNQWDVLVQSTVSRKQPLMLAITTAPETKQVFAYDKFVWAERILRGAVEADHVFAAIYTIDANDNPKSLEALRKSHPSLGADFLPETFLLNEIAELKETPSGLNNFLQFRANVTPERTLSKQPSVSSEGWDRCTHLELLPGAKDCADAARKLCAMNGGKHVWLGLDMGGTQDMAALAFVFRSAYLQPHKRKTDGSVEEWAEEHPKRFVHVVYWMPEYGLLEKERKWHVPLSTWVRNGFIKLCPGDMVDSRVIRDYLLEVVARDFTVYDLGFDEWQAKVMCAELNERSRIECVKVPQLPSVLSVPIREFKDDIRRGELVHFGNPVLKWNAENVYFGEFDDTAHGGLKPQKAGGEIYKIDGVSAVINAYARMLASPQGVTYSGKVAFV